MFDVLAVALGAVDFFGLFPLFVLGHGHHNSEFFATGLALIIVFWHIVLSSLFGSSVDLSLPILIYSW